MLDPNDRKAGRFSTTEDGHYVGDDGFIIPKNFDEFYERYPKYVLTWVRKRLNRFEVDETVEDRVQEILIAMKFLPVRSVRRELRPQGTVKACMDLIEAFDPHEEGGASEPIFRRYLVARIEGLFQQFAAKQRVMESAETERE